MTRLAASGHCEPAWPAQCAEAILEGIPGADSRQLMVVEPGPPHPRLIQFEPEGPDQVQVGPYIRAQANDVARVGRDFRLVQDDMKHGLDLGLLCGGAQDTRIARARDRDDPLH